jgi:hypothetical protein
MVGTAVAALDNVVDDKTTADTMVGRVAVWARTLIIIALKRDGA